MEKILKKINLVQTNIDKINKNAENPFYRSNYADLNNIKDHLQTYLEANQLMIFHKVSAGSLITTVYDLESKESLSSEINLSMSDPQKKGGEITYYRRYNLVALFDLKIEDDDANETTKPPSNYKDKPKIDVWLSDSDLEVAKKLSADKIKSVLKKYDGKTVFKDGKLYGMKKDYRTQLEKLT